ncbi:hypothetical protein ABS767_12185 [Sphingomonas sp. ST-64]|uniref:HNH endonuclease n=1 Tax=Sphingomonas plantiphila TaxID=3163295 RepID=A0ABW8YRC3_9SPHN
MSKRHRGKTCVYCAGPGISDSADHVFSREFLPVEHRGNMPKVPACTPCNRAKSDLEHYLSAVLPFGGRHAGSSEMLEAEVPRRLAKNPRLHRELATGQQTIWVEQNGVILPTLAIPFDGTKLDALFAMLARGLAFHHFGVVIPSTHFIGAGTLARVGEQAMEGLLALNAKVRVAVSVGDGLLDYEGAQGVGDPALTIWRFRLYGGVMLADGDAPGERLTTIWASSSPQKEQSLFGLE